MQVQEEKASDGTHPNDEAVSYIALQQTTSQLDGTPFEVQRAGGITDEWSQLTFQQEYKIPRFVAGMQTFNGSNTANLRYRNFTSTSVEVKVEEEQSADAETDHTSEVVGYAVFGDSV